MSAACRQSKAKETANTIFAGKPNITTLEEYDDDELMLNVLRCHETY